MSLLKHVWEWRGPRKVYFTVPDNEKSGSSSEADDSDSFQSMETSRSRTVKLHRLLYAMIGLATASFLIFSTLTFMNWNRYPSFKTPVPDIPLETRTYIQEKRFSDPPTKENDQAWWDLFPDRGGGFVGITNPSQYDLKPGVNTLDKGILNYGVSAFHQLHCLLLIRDWYFKFLNDDEARKLAQDPKSRVAFEIEHTGHCFDYIRWNIMCSADMTIEWARMPNSRDINGESVPHKQCKNWDHITNFMSAHPPGRDKPGTHHDPHP